MEDYLYVQFVENVARYFILVTKHEYVKQEFELLLELEKIRETVMYKSFTFKLWRKIEFLF